jgi:hypothetical protein
VWQLGFILVLAAPEHIAIAAGGTPPLIHAKSKSLQSDNASLDEQALRYLETKGGTAHVQELYEALSIRNRSLAKADLVDCVWRLDEQEKVELQDLPPSTKSLPEYLMHWERNVWLYASLTISIVTIIAIYVLPADLPLVAIRWVLGSIFVLFIPGYVTVEALFPKGRELDAIERFALSVGLSLALVPLVGLLLNYTPWGIRLNPIVVSLTILTVGLAMVALAREYRLSTIIQTLNGARGSS